MSNPKPSMGNIQSRVALLLKGSLAPNTIKTYQTSISVFKKFCKQYSFKLQLPFQTRHVVLFISYCFEWGCTPATTRTYVSGLSFYHKINGFHDPTDAFIITKLLEGCRRSRNTTDSRSPITLDILRKVLTSLTHCCHSNYETELFYATYSLAYFGLFRVSELVYTDENYKHRPLQLNDVVFIDDYQSVMITIRQSKTNQNGPPTVLIIPSEKGDYCPVRALLRYSKLRPSTGDQLFVHNDGAPLTRYQFTAVLGRCIRHTGLHNGHYTSHSFRIGRATQLAADGLPMATIKKLGRWRSHACKTYIRKH